MPNASIPPRAIALHPSLDPAAWHAARHDDSVLVADGSQVRVTVRGGHLSVSDGPPGGKRERRFARVPRVLSRLVILGGHGYVTVEAQRWMAAGGVSWSVLDTYADDAPIAVSGPERADARLLRAQAFASEGGPLESAGVMVTQSLLAAKLEDQAHNLEVVFRAGIDARTLRELASQVRMAGTLPECRSLEGQGAAVYWQVWAGRVRAPFSPEDMKRVPVHWLEFAGRTSLTAENERNKDATDPVNAILNYAYRVGESEAIHACHAFGLHPALGILHTDKQARNSMALDLLEVIRPAIDRSVLGMMDTGLGIPYGADGSPRYLDRRYLHETDNGTVRLIPPLTHYLAGHAAQWGEKLRAHAQAAARTLGIASPATVTVPKARRAAKPRIPAAARKRARLREGTKPADLLPDRVWRQVAALIPAPEGIGGPGRPVDIAQDRAAVAMLAANLLLGVPRSAIPVDVSRDICRARLQTWQWVKVPGQNRPVWDAIAEVMQESGHLSALVVRG